jgi:hypothetical protein
MTVDMDETFAAALRELLVERVQTSPVPGSRSWWLRRWDIRAGVVVAVLAGGGGIAAAAGVFSSGPPGSEVVTPLTAAVSFTGDGTQTVALGAPPAGANAIAYTFSCLTAGTFTFSDGSRLTCGQADTSGRTPPTNILPLAPGQDSTTITAGAGERWHLTASYATATTSPWLVNASGQTYGTQNQNGTPDLVAVIATNGREGYAYANELDGPYPTTPSQAIAENNQAEALTVYESDGKTQIGEFIVGAGAATTVTITTTYPTTTPTIKTTTTSTAEPPPGTST